MAALVILALARLQALVGHRVPGGQRYDERDARSRRSQRRCRRPHQMVAARRRSRRRQLLPCRHWSRGRRMRRPLRDRRHSHNRLPRARSRGSNRPGRQRSQRPQATQPPVTPTPQRAADGPTPTHRGSRTIAERGRRAATTDNGSSESRGAANPPPPPSQPLPRAAAARTPHRRHRHSPRLRRSPVESDDALIRGVIRTYERAIETKNVDLFRSVRPGLSSAEEGRLRASFNQVDSQQVDIVVDDLRVDGRAATVRLSRRDTVMSGGRRQTNASRQTLRFEKAAAGWIITEIIGQ